MRLLLPYELGLHQLGIEPHKFSYPYQGLNQRLIGPTEDPRVQHGLIA